MNTHGFGPKYRDRAREVDRRAARETTRQATVMIPQTPRCNEAKCQDAH